MQTDDYAVICFMKGIIFYICTTKNSVIRQGFSVNEQFKNIVFWRSKKFKK